MAKMTATAMVTFTVWNVTTDNRSLLHSINQSVCMDISPKQEVIPIQCIQIELTLVTDIALYRASINHLKLSIHYSLGLPLVLLPYTTPSYTFFVHRPFSIMSNLPFHSSCLLLTSSNTPTCPSLRKTSSFVTLSLQHTPSIPLNTFIWVAWILDFCSFLGAHASHPYISTGITVELTTFSFVYLLSSLLNIFTKGKYTTEIVYRGYKTYLLYYIY